MKRHTIARATGLWIATTIALGVMTSGCSETADGHGTGAAATASSPALAVADIQTPSLPNAESLESLQTVDVDPRDHTGPIDFGRDVQPILERSCYRCHGARKKRGELRLDKKRYAAEGGESGAVIVPGEKHASNLFQRISLPEDHDDYMPSKGDPLPPHDVAVIGRWIDEGAVWPDELP